MAPKPTQSDQDALDLVTRKFKRMNESHQARCARYKQRYDAWTGTLRTDNDIWMSQLAPKWAFQKLDVLMAHLVDDMPMGRVYANQPGEQCESAATLMQKALNEFRRKDGRERKNYPFVQQALVMGHSPAKVSWKYEHAPQNYVQWSQDVGGNLVGNKATKNVCFWDQPSFTVIPVEDFLWDPSASSLDLASDCIYRSWETIENLRFMQDNGVYRNVDQIEAMRGGAFSPKEASASYLKVDRKGRVEILEYWQRNRLITVANRRVVLRDQENPYWHRKLPFVVGTTLPDLYRIDGFSEVELLAELQAACWEFLNQKIDNTRFISNAMLIVRGGLDMTKARMEPGGILEIESSDQVEPWTPNISVVQPLIQAEQDLRNVMDDISGVTPYISGAGTEGIDPHTATLVNAMQSMAARRVQKKRNLIYDAHRLSGIQEIQLMQQLMNKPLAVRVDSDEGMEWTPIEPWQIADADLSYEIDETNESLDRQERRAEAQQLWAVAMQTPPGLVNWDLKKLATDLLTAFDKTNPDEYFTAPPALPMMPVPPGVPGGPDVNGAGAPPTGGLPPNGAPAAHRGLLTNVTNPSFAGRPMNPTPAGPAGRQR